MHNREKEKFHLKKTVNIFCTWAHKAYYYVSMQDMEGTSACEQLYTQGTLSREHVSKQGTLICEHLST